MKRSVPLSDEVSLSRAKRRLGWWHCDQQWNRTKRRGTVGFQ
jgi:hypothetical protein